VSDDGWRLIFETEREILHRRLERWIGERDGEPRAPEGEGAPTRRSRPERRRRRVRTGAIIGWTLSLSLHAILAAMLLPHLLREPPPEPEAPPLHIRFVSRESLSPKIEAPPAPAIEVPPAPPPPEPATESPPEMEDPSRTESPELAAEREASAESEPREPRATEIPAPFGLAPGAERGGRSALGARYGERAEALRVYGGGAETELVVRRGLEWLSRHQDPDGSWDPHGFSRHCRPGISCTGGGFPEYRTGVTGLALLAFLGAGIDHREEGPGRRTVAGAIEWLLAQQDEEGCFGPRDGQYLYDHGIATLAIAEGAALTRDPELFAAAARGVRFIEAAQQAGGGWDYTNIRTNRNDLSVSGWQVMALHSAAEAGIPVSATTLSRLETYLRQAVRADGSAIYADRGTGAGRGGVSIAAVGLLSKLYLGWSPRSSETQRAAVRIVRQGPDPGARADWDRTYQSLYYWYTATLALFHVGGEPWEAWNLYLQRSVLPLQHREGELEGSFDPDPNWIGAAGGRVTSTALGILTFEVYYRYTPLFRQLGLSPGAGRGETDGGD